MLRTWRWALTVLVLGLVGYLSLLAWLRLEVSRLEGATVSRADAVIVLGARVFYPQKPRINPCLNARVQHGAGLVLADNAKWLIVSGGLDREDGAVEAEHMRDLAVQAGVPKDRILLEDQSTSTRENLEFSKRILETRGLNSVIVVTEPFHAPRAGLLARKLGLTAQVSPAPGSPCSERAAFAIRSYLREPLAILENWWRGWL